MAAIAKMLGTSDNLLAGDLPSLKIAWLKKAELSEYLDNFQLLPVAMPIPEFLARVILLHFISAKGIRNNNPPIAKATVVVCLFLKKSDPLLAG